MRKAIIILLVTTILGLSLPVPAYAAPALVPCGRTAPANFTGSTVGTPYEQCNFQHLIILIIRLINYLISVAAIVAMYHILLSGWNLITAMGSTDKITAGKQGITHAVVGFAMVVLAFVFINLLVNLLLARPNTAREWWSIECLYNINNSDCLVGSIEP
jgi:hypothetical protein